MNLIIMATSLVYIGGSRSLLLLASEENGGPLAENKETLTAEDAYTFPLVGSATLFGLYMVFKYVDKGTINVIVSLYFLLMGVVTFSSFLSKVFPSGKKAARFGFKYKFPMIGEIDMLLSLQDIFFIVIGTSLSYGYYMTKHFMLNNLFGIVFCIGAMEKISVGSYKIGAALLIGLFFYDIFWVFGTDVMVTVAKSFDGPIKLLFPTKFATLNAKAEFSLLGLGDIVVPGLFVAILHRFDAVRAQAVIKHHGESVDAFYRPYFHWNVVCYAIGLGITVFVMFFFKAAQPALLYLVPCCLLGSLLVAVARGELKELVDYNEEVPKTEEAAAKKDK